MEEGVGEEQGSRGGERGMERGGVGGRGGGEEECLCERESKTLRLDEEFDPDAQCDLYK
jgi:hypothetical protein